MKAKVNKVVMKAFIRKELFIRDERGDTNFISILVLLGIALALAAIFLAFREKVVAWVEENVATFF